EKERMRSAVTGRCPPLDPAASLEHVQQPGESCTFDIERLADRCLRAAWIGFDEQHYGILRRAHIHRRQRADEVLEHRDLQAAQEIAEVSVECAEFHPLALVRQ